MYGKGSPDIQVMVVSPCSLNIIIHTPSTHNIDVEDMPTRCGDFVVDLERGEECDAGPDSILRLDLCCDNSIMSISLPGCVEVSLTATSTNSAHLILLV